MNPVPIARPFEFAEGTLIRVCVLLLVAVACLLALRKAPATARHVVLTILFAGLILLPLVTWLCPASSITWHTALFQQRSQTENARNSSELHTAVSEVNDGNYMPSRAPVFHDALQSFPITNANFGKRHPKAQGPVVAAAMETSLTSIRPATRPQIEPSHRMNARGGSVPLTVRSGLIQAAVLLVWAIGFGIEMLRLAAGLAGAARLRRSARPIDDIAVLSAAAAIRCQLGMRRAVTVLQTSGSSCQGVPVTLGLMRPAILMPAHLLTLPGERMRPIVLHEMAHIARLDWPIQMMAQVARAVYWFLPPVRWAARQLYIECERACDDQVVLAGVPPTLYAETLLEVLRTMNPCPAYACSVLSMVMPPMEARIRAILSPGRRYALRRSTALLTAAIGAPCVLVIAEVHVAATPRQTTTVQQSPTTSHHSHLKASHSNRAATTATTARSRTTGTAHTTMTSPSHDVQIRLLQQRLAAVEQQLARNAAENRLLRVQLKQQQDRQHALLQRAIDMSTSEKALQGKHETTAMLHDTGSAVHSLTVSQQSRIDTLKAELADLTQQRALLQQTLQRNEQLYKLGFSASNPVNQARAQLEQNQAEIAQVQHYLVEAEAGIQRAQHDALRDTLQAQIKRLQAYLQGQQELLRTVRLRYQTGIATESDVSDAEQSVSRTRIEIDRLQIQLLETDDK